MENDDNNEYLDPQDSHFFVVFVRTRKKLDKYFKNNRIRNKQIIDIKRIIEEERINFNDSKSVAFFKILVWNKIRTAKEKGKDIYYIPNFTNHNLNIKSLLNLKQQIENNITFNLLLFYDEFIGTNWLIDILEDMDIFNNSQILKDYQPDKFTYTQILNEIYDYPKVEHGDV